MNLCRLVLFLFSFLPMPRRQPSRSGRGRSRLPIVSSSSSATPAPAPVEEEQEDDLDDLPTEPPPADGKRPAPDPMADLDSLLGSTLSMDPDGLYDLPPPDDTDTKTLGPTTAQPLFGSAGRAALETDASAKISAARAGMGSMVAHVRAGYWKNRSVQTEVLYWAHASDLLAAKNGPSLKNFPHRRILALCAVDDLDTWEASKAVMGPLPGGSLLSRDARRVILQDLTAASKLRAMNARLGKKD